MIVDFGEFAPDRSPFDPSATPFLRNLVPRVGGYSPFPSFAPISTALPSAPRGFFLASQDGGGYAVFAATASKLYRLNSSFGWDDVSRLVGGAYALPAGRTWSFAQYGTLVLATNGFDDIQKYDLAVPAQFSALLNAPKAQNVAVMGDFVFLTNTEASTRQCRWSALNNPEFWTEGQRASDSQLFPDGGDIFASVSFDRGSVIFQENVIREAMLALDTPLIMTFNKTVENHGTIARRSVVSTSAGIFYLALDGFYKYGAPPVAIGDERVDRYILDNVDINDLRNVVGGTDPVRKIVYWAYRTQNGPTGGFDRIIAYQYALDRWFEVLPPTLTSVASAGTSPGYTLEGLDSLGFTLDTLGVSLDSPIWVGGSPNLAAFNADHRFGFFSGEPMFAQGRTARIAFAEGRRTFVSGFRPITDAAGATGRVSAASEASAEGMWGADAGMNRNGLIPARKDGRYHRFEVTIPGGEPWTYINGLEPELRGAGLQ